MCVCVRLYSFTSLYIYINVCVCTPYSRTIYSVCTGFIPFLPTPCYLHARLVRFLHPLKNFELFSSSFSFVYSVCAGLGA